MSVGDDNALTVSKLKVANEASTGAPVVTLIWQHFEKNAHSSSITGKSCQLLLPSQVCIIRVTYNTGVQFLEDNLLVTTSVDQRLNIWHYDPVKSTVKLTFSFTHDVADAANLKALKNRLECQ